jgi:pimeloyl-ACP methyl ester carboxylesterase
MSLGGLAAIALADSRPELVRRLVLVDITPGVDRGKAKAITDFVRGPATFASFDEILARTTEHNPTRTESSLRRGILHNAEQLEDGSWRWRYRRDDDFFASDDDIDATGRLWDALGRVGVPVLLARGMLPQSVVDDADEAELLRALPKARIEHFAKAGHSIQGDMPVELAEAIADFVDGSGG